MLDAESQLSDIDMLFRRSQSYKNPCFITEILEMQLGHTQCCNGSVLRQISKEVGGVS
jgi:hypothetical protein